MLLYRLAIILFLQCFVVLYKVYDKYHRWYSQMEFVIVFIIGSSITYVNEFKRGVAFIVVAVSIKRYDNRTDV